MGTQMTLDNSSEVVALAEQMIEEDLPMEAYAQEPEEQEDGSYMVDLDALEEAGEQRPQGFDDNLAEQLPEPELAALATTLLELIELDANAYEKDHELYAKGLKRTGLTEDDDTAEAFTGSSRATHPMLMEACIDFAARAIKELFPSQGPVKIAAENIRTRADAKKADAKKAVLNWQLTTQIEEYYAELQRGLSQTPLGGSQYLKIFHDSVLKRPVAQYVPSDKMLLPYSAASFYTAERRTHILDLTEHDIDQRKQSGEYRDVLLGGPMTAGATSEPSRVIDSIQGKTPDAQNEDGLRTVYEVDCLWQIKGDKLAGGQTVPYIITIDEYSQKILAIRRNWDPDDENRRRLDWVVELPFIPWRGSKSIGLFHIIGGLSVAATGALRALLDSALINNLPVLFKLKGAKLNGQTVTVNGMRIVEIEGPTGANDIREVMMPQPFGPPSQVLYQLLEWVTNHARQTIGTAAERIADQRADMPVGTVLALIEEGSHPTSAIHQGLHRAQAKAISIVCRLNQQHLDLSELQARFPGSKLTREDFSDYQALVPVSDPHIFSTAQRTAQVQGVLQLASGAPQLYDAYWLHRRALEQMRVPDIDQVLPPPKGPKELNPVAENLSMLMQRPVAAFPDQDHLAHLAVHATFVLDQATGGSPLMLPRLVQPMLEHFAQHSGMLYAQTYNGVISEATGGIEISELMKDNALNPEIDKTLAMAAEQVHARLAKKLAPFAQVVQQLMQVAQQLAPKPQMDPQSQVALQLGTMEHQRRQQQDQVAMQLEAQKQELQKVKDEFERHIKGQTAARDAERADAELMLKAQEGARDAELRAQELQLKARMDTSKIEAMQLEQALTAAEADHRRQLALAELQFGQQAQLNEQELDAHYQALKAETERHYKDTQNLVSYLKNAADNVTKERIAELRLAVEAGMQGADKRLEAATKLTQTAASTQQADDALVMEIAEALRGLARSQVELQQYMDTKLARQVVSTEKDNSGSSTGEAAVKD